MACPHCGSRLVCFSAQPPQRLICVGCGRPLAQGPITPAWVWLQLHWAQLLLFLGLVLIPMVLLTLSPAIERAETHRTSRFGRPSSSRLLSRSQKRAQSSEPLRRRQVPSSFSNSR